MKKKNRFSRLLAMLVALAMLVNSQGMASIASVIGVVTSGGQQTEETAQAAERVAGSGSESEGLLPAVSGTEPGAGQPAGNGTEPGAEQPAVSGTEPGAEQPAGNGAEPGTEQSAGNGTEPGTEQSAESGTEPGTEQPAVSGRELGTEQPAVNETELGTEQSAVNETELGTEQPAVNETELGTEQPAANETELGTELSAESETEPGTELSAEGETELGTELSAEGETELGTELSAEGETELGTEPAVELETETESETEAERAYVCENEELSVTAWVLPDAGIPEDAVLMADKLEEGTPEYAAAYAAAEASLQLAEDEELWFVPYDVYFLAGAERIEPTDGMVRVEMKFAEEPQEEILAADGAAAAVAEEPVMEEPVAEAADGTAAADIYSQETVGETFAVHIKSDGEVEQMENCSEEEQALAFDVSSFSVMGPAQVRKIAAPNAGTPEETQDVYVVLYEDGEMVFQYGDVVDEERNAKAGYPKKMSESSLKNGYYHYSNLLWNKDRSDIKKVTFKDAIRPENMEFWFQYCGNLTEVDLSGADLSGLTDMDSMFYGCSKLTTLDSSNWNVENAADMSSMFYGCSKLTTLDLSGWKTDKATNMHSMFSNCTELTDLNLNGWNTASVTDMGSMFYECKGLATLNLGVSWDTASVTDMSSMFYNCRGLTALDLNSWDTHSVTKMNSMFYNCMGLTALDLNKWNTASVENMGSMFYNCTGLVDLDLGSWNTQNVTSMSGMFYCCEGLTALDLGNWNTTNVTSMSDMFERCKGLSALNLSSWQTGNVTSMYEMFYGCSGLTDLKLSGWNLQSVTNMGSIFSGCSSLTTLDLSGWNTQSVTNMSSMFSSCSSLATLNLNDWDTKNVTSMSSMFYGCKGLATLDLSGWDTKNVTNMSSMFASCEGLVTLKLGDSWDTQNVIYMSYMFRYCNRLSDMDFSGWETGNVTDMSYMFSSYKGFTGQGLNSWNTSNVKNMSYMFSGCTGLTSPNMSGWNTGSVTNMSYMFSSCSGFTTLDLSAWNWNTENVTNMSSMFSGCTGLTSLNLTGLNTGKVTSMDSMFLSCSKLTSLDLSTWNWDTHSVTSMDSMFSRCSGLTSLNLKGLNTESVRDMDSMFYYSQALTELDLSELNTGSVTTMSSMFSSCDNLRKLVLGAGFRFVGNPRLPGTSWKRSSDKKVCTLDEFYKLTGEDTAGDWYRDMTLTFHGNGGKPTPSKKQGYGCDILDELPKATRKGSDFAGWWTQPNGGEQLKEGDMTTLATVYAHWTDHSYTLTLYANNGKSLTEGQSFTKKLGYRERFQLGTSFTIEESGETVTFTNGDQVLTGWNTRPDGSGDSYGVDETVTQLTEEDEATFVLYAQWAEPDDEWIEVTFDIGEGKNAGVSEMPTLRFKKGSSFGSLGKPYWKGHTFVAWHIDGANGYTVSSNTKVPDKNTVLYAEWKTDPIVIFDYNSPDGKEREPVKRSVVSGKKVGVLPVLSIPGNNKTMIGWFTEKDEGEQITEETEIREDVTYYAHWGWRPKFNGNGGMVVYKDAKGNPVTVAFQDTSEYKVGQLPTARLDGYTFLGWQRSGHEDFVMTDEIIDLSEGCEFTARWEKEETVKLTLNPNGGKLGDSTGVKIYTVYKGKPVGELPVPSRSTSSKEYLFLGWFTDSGDSGEEGKSCTRDSVFEEDTTLIARWAEKTLTVTFDKNGGSIEPSKKTIKVPVGGTIGTLPGCKYNNENKKILEGWYLDQAGTGEKLTTSTRITEDVTYYAKWVDFTEIEKYTVDDKNLYTYGAEWVNASNNNVDNLGNNLEFHPQNNDSQTATMRVFFELHDDAGLTEEGFLPIGSVEIWIPQYVFWDWNHERIGKANLSEIMPTLPDKRGDMYFSIDQTKTDATEGRYYVAVNNVPLNGGTGLDVTVSYTVKPNQVPGGACDSNGRYEEEYEFFDNDNVRVEFKIDNNEDGKYESESEEVLSLEMHTRPSTEQSKSYKSISYTWDSKWGEKPEDAEDYFYVIWTLGMRYYSSSNQPSAYVWSEDGTVHDGTVVYMSKITDEDNGNGDNGLWTTGCEVVTRHPNELLEDIPDTGRHLHNEAILNLIWKSTKKNNPDVHYQREYRVSADYTLYQAKYPEGQFTKNNTTGSVKTVSGGQETILDDNKPVSMEWELIYEGAGSKPPIWDDSTKSYKAEERTIKFSDGMREDLLYSSGSAANKYNWVPDSGNRPLSDNDYCFTSLYFELTEYDAHPVAEDVWSKEYAHADKADYQGIDVYIRRKGKSKFEFYQTVMPVNQSSLALPEDTVGFELRHKTAFYSTKLDVKAYMRLNPTQEVRSWVQDDVSADATSIFKNIARCDIWYEDENENDPFHFHVTNRTADDDRANKECYELNISQTNQYTDKFIGDSDFIWDNKSGETDLPVQICGWNINNGGRTKQIRTGIFYDLLPAGTSVDPATVFCIPVGSRTTYDLSWDTYKRTSTEDFTRMAQSSSRLNEALYDVQFEENWEDSGRTMMIISFAVPENVTAVGMDAYYLLHNTSENVEAKGNTVTNYVAFVNTTEGAAKPASTSSSISITGNSKNYYQRLQEQYDGYISYAQAGGNYKLVSARSWAFGKSVSTGGDYTVRGKTKPGGDYTYRLKYGQSAYAENSDIVFYDVIERGATEHSSEDVNERSEWLGTLVSVDVSAIAQMENAGKPGVYCDPVVLYATKPRDQFVEGDYNLSAGIWSQSPPADLADVTAIAVDCTKDTEGEPFVLEGAKDLSVYLHMKAPEDAVPEEKITYNEAVIYTKKKGTPEPLKEVSEACVTIEEVEPELHKAADPESGTEEKPKVVHLLDKINYTLSVSNKGTQFPMEDIVVEDEIPEHLQFNTSDISLYFGEDPGKAVKLSLSPRVKLQRQGQKLTITIYTLYVGETVHIVIPTTVQIADYLFENKAVITHADGREKHIESETTWHEAIPIGIAVRKTGIGGKRIGGATLALYRKMDDGTEEEIEGFEQTSEEGKMLAFKVPGPGKYILREKEAPEGYVKAKDIEFTVVDEEGNMTDADGNPLEFLKMEDPYTSVAIRKESISGAAIAGARLAIYEKADYYRADGSVNAGATALAEWTTTADEEWHEVNAVLEEGGTFVLVELAPPEGYLPAEPVEFTMPTDDPDTPDVNEAATPQQVEMTDPYETPVTAAIAGTKVLTGREWMDTDKFTFELTETTQPVDGDTEVPDKLTGPKTATATGAEKNFDFGTFTYTKPYVHTYEVRETSGSGRGITADGETYTVTVTVTDSENGMLRTEVTYPQKGKDAPAAKLTFTNTYKAAEGSAVVGATKRLETLSGPEQTLRDGEFVFSLTPVRAVGTDGETAITDPNGVLTASNDGDGKVAFEPLKYTQAGTYTYELKEEATEETGITTDATVYTVTVTVTDDNEGQLQTSVAYGSGAEEVDAEDVTFVNTYTEEKKGSVTLKKVSEDDKAAIAGTRFQLYHKTEDGWELYSDETYVTAEDGTLRVTGLRKNDYYFVETQASAGYRIATDADGNPLHYPFTVDPETQAEIELEVTNTPETPDAPEEQTEKQTEEQTEEKTGSVTLKKVSEHNKVSIAGTQFQLYHKTGDGWGLYSDETYVTDRNGTLRVTGLPENDYYFVETQASAGYLIATDADGSPLRYPFTVDADVQAEVELEVTNAPERTEEGTSLIVTKSIQYHGEEWNSEDAVFYVALFDDEALTSRVSEVKPIVFEKGMAASTVFEDLDFGTYYVAETTKDGAPLNSEGGKVPTGERFSVDFYEGNMVTVEKGDGTKKVSFRNVFLEMPKSGYYKEGELTLTKRLLGADGKPKRSHKTFYAGIFADKGLTQLSGAVSQNIVEFDMDGKASVSVAVKAAAEPSEQTVLYVAEVDREGRPVAGKESFRYDVSVEGSKVSIDLDNLTGAAVITNQELDESESEVWEDAESEDEEVVPEGTDSVKTGDDTPILQYVGLLLAAALLLSLILVFRRKRRG